MRLKGKIAVVTGAASGIGRAIAELFAEEGAVVYATDIALLANPNGPKNVIHLQHDVSQEDQWRAVIARVEADQGRLSILVNNAGIVGSYEPMRFCIHGCVYAGCCGEPARPLFGNPHLRSSYEERRRRLDR